MELQKKNTHDPGTEQLPEPRPEKGGGIWPGLAALLAVLAVGAAAFWLTRDTSTREKWREEAAAFLDEASSGTPFAGAGDLLRQGPPPLPLAVTNPSTAPGTLAGRNVQGTVGAPVDPGAEEQGAQELPVIPPVTEDSRVRPDVVADLAKYLVSRYRPGQHGGSLGVTVQALNHRCGARLAEMAGGRAAILRYAFQPTMIQSLYALYVGRFMDDLAAAAQEAGLAPEQRRQFFMVLAGRSVMLAGALEGVAALPDLEQRLSVVERLAQNAVDINAQMSTALFELDELREARAPRAQMDATQLRVDGLGARYRRALEEHAVAQRALVTAIRKGAGQALDDDALLFLAHWVARRLADDSDALASVRSASGVLREFARRCALAGSGSQTARQDEAGRRHVQEDASQAAGRMSLPPARPASGASGDAGQASGHDPTDAGPQTVPVPVHIGGAQ